jgi:hypothetical protein
MCAIIRAARVFFRAATAHQPAAHGTTLKLRYNPAAMNSISDLKQFLDAARSQGASDETLVALLRGREWPEEEVYRVLADHF